MITHYNPSLAQKCKVGSKIKRKEKRKGKKKTWYKNHIKKKKYYNLNRCKEYNLTKIKYHLIIQTPS